VAETRRLLTWRNVSTGTCATFLDAGRSRPPRRGWSRFARNLWERHPHGRSLDEPVSVVIPTNGPATGYEHAVSVADEDANIARRGGNGLPVQGLPTMEPLPHLHHPS
jgi:hypothetical protein